MRILWDNRGMESVTLFGRSRWNEVGVLCFPAGENGVGVIGRISFLGFFLFVAVEPQ